MDKLKRITRDPQKMGGVPCIRDLRMPVATVLAMLSEGVSIEQILKEHPELEQEDIREVFQYVSEFLQVREFPIAV